MHADLWVLLKTEKDLCHRKEHSGTEKDFYLPFYAILKYVNNILGRNIYF